MGISYRLVQFWHMLAAKPLSEEVLQEIGGVLTPAESELFGRFPESEKRHAYRVKQTLEDAGHNHPDLLTAALLHDIGKTKEPLSLRERTLIVLVQKFLPRQAEKWGQGQAIGWKRPFVVKENHPMWGSEMARSAGCRQLTINLIDRHQDPIPFRSDSEEDQLLYLLQWADNSS